MRYVGIIWREQSEAQYLLNVSFKVISASVSKLFGMLEGWGGVDVSKPVEGGRVEIGLLQAVCDHGWG